MPDRLCSHCCCWVRLTGPEGGALEMGECRHSPPMPVLSLSFSPSGEVLVTRAWPRTAANDWCFQFSPGAAIA
jgi:hypothetical protein